MKDKITGVLIGAVITGGVAAGIPASKADVYEKVSDSEVKITRSVEEKVDIEAIVNARKERQTQCEADLGVMDELIQKAKQAGVDVSEK